MVAETALVTSVAVVVVVAAAAVVVVVEDHDLQIWVKCLLLSKVVIPPIQSAPFNLLLDAHLRYLFVMGHAGL